MAFTLKADCCGCSACANVCTKGCIRMSDNQEGFLVPVFDDTNCVNCGACENVCMLNAETETRKPLTTYVSSNKNTEVVNASSSGGVFASLAEKIIETGGVVFGASFNTNWRATITYIDSLKDLPLLMGSKYMQASIGYSYAQCKDFLKAGRMVLFSATPCQIKGLKMYLRQDYDNLICVDVACHGAPSPKVWDMYLDDLSKRFNKYKDSNIWDFNARKKWRNLHFQVYQKGDYFYFRSMPYENQYYKAFLRGLINRKSCYNCPAKAGRSLSDITLADCWGAEKITGRHDNNSGLSLVLINTTKGTVFYGSCDVNNESVSYEKALLYNNSLVKSSACHINRDGFFRDFTYCESVIDLLNITFKREEKLSLSRILKYIKNYLYRQSLLLKNNSTSLLRAESYEKIKKPCQSFSKYDIVKISFREKKNGWRNYNFMIKWR